MKRLTTICFALLAGSSVFAATNIYTGLNVMKYNPTTGEISPPVTNLNFGGQAIVVSNAPTADEHVANKAYVDSQAGGTNLFAGAGTTGLITSAAGDAGKFLKADGSWAVGGGDTTYTNYLYRYIEGMLPDCLANGTSVTITAGAAWISNKFVRLTTNQTYYLTSLAAGEDWHYIYADYSASTPTAISLYDATNVPAQVGALDGGWYHPTTVGDRAIGAMWSTNGAANLACNRLARDRYYLGERISMASNMNPDGTWQTPDDNPGAAITPVFVKSITVVMSAEDNNAPCTAYMISKEGADAGSAVNGPFVVGGNDVCMGTVRISLEDSRDTRIAGDANDDNALSAWMVAFDIIPEPRPSCLWPTFIVSTD